MYQAVAGMVGVGPDVAMCGVPGGLTCRRLLSGFLLNREVPGARHANRTHNPVPEILCGCSELTSLSAGELKISIKVGEWNCGTPDLTNMAAELMPLDPGERHVPGSFTDEPSGSPDFKTKKQSDRKWARILRPFALPQNDSGNVNSGETVPEKPFSPLHFLTLVNNLPASLLTAGDCFNRD